MLVIKNNLLYFIKLKSTYITFLCLFILTLITDISLSISLANYYFLKIVLFWISFSLIILQITILNIQIFKVIFFEHKRIGILDLEISKGIKKPYVFIYRLITSFIITLSAYLINVIFYEAIVLPNAIVVISGISLFAYAVITIIIFDFMFKGFMILLTIMKGSALGISLGSIIGVLTLVNPLLTLSFTAPMSKIISTTNNKISYKAVDFDNLYIASELFTISNNYNDGILDNYKKQFSSLSDNLNNAQDISENLFFSEQSEICKQANYTCNDDEKDLINSQNYFIKNIFYLNTVLGFDTDTIIKLVENNVFQGIKKDNSSSLSYEDYLDNQVVIDLNENIFNTLEDGKDYSNIWKNIFNNKNDLSPRYIYKNFNISLKFIEKNIDSKYKQEWIDIEPLLTSYFFNVVYYNRSINYNGNELSDAIYGGGGGFYAPISINYDILGETLKNVNPFILQFKSMLYNMFSWIYESPLEENQENLLSFFNFINQDDNGSEMTINQKNNYLKSWSNYIYSNSKKYFSSPFVIYSSFLYNQSPKYLDNVYSNSMDTITYTPYKDIVNPYGPINIHLDNNGEVDELSIEHKLVYINSLVWIMPILIGCMLMSLGGYIFIKRLIQ